MRIDLLDADGGVLITGIGRDVVPLLPGETDGTAPTSAPWAAATAA